MEVGVCGELLGGSLLEGAGEFVELGRLGIGVLPEEAGHWRCGGGGVG